MFLGKAISVLLDLKDLMALARKIVSGDEEDEAETMEEVFAKANRSGLQSGGTPQTPRVDQLQ